MISMQTKINLFYEFLDLINTAIRQTIKQIAEMNKILLSNSKELSHVFKSVNGT